MILSKNTYFFKSESAPLEFNDRLANITLQKNLLTMEKTKKEFIGKIGKNKFSIIDSWFPLGVACVMKGEIKQEYTTEITLNTSLHIAFRILFIIWAIMIVSLTVLSSIKEFHIGPYIALTIGIILFGLFFHAVYVLSRNRAINKFEGILGLERINNVA